LWATRQVCPIYYINEWGFCPLAKIRFNKKCNTWYLYDKNNKYIRALGKITKEQAEREKELFVKQTTINLSCHKMTRS